LRLVADRQIKLCATAAVWDEYETRVVEELARRRPSVNPRPALDWLLTVAQFVDAAPLGKPRSRDLKDDRYVACALGANAEAIVSNDRDLLDLGQPFGIAMLTPIELIKRVRGRTAL
jgi:predicted nucleic acid-binding protein